MIPSPEALIFDVDGTLAETEETHRAAFNDAFAEAGLDWAWDRGLYHDLLKVTGGKERIAHFIAREAPGVSDAEALVRRLHVRKTDLYAARVAAGEVALRPGIAELIGEARRRGVKLGIATTTTQTAIDALLSATLGREAIGWFAAVACGDMARAKKPDPDVYRIALAGLATPAEKALAIEDSWNGLMAARGAGLEVIATPSHYTEGEDFSEARLVTTPDRIAEALGWA